MKRAFLLIALFVAGVCCAAVRKPNIIFLFADDMRADSIGALGNPIVKTPNLDRLVQRGCAIQNAYCLGANVGAVCTPSRNMLLTGNAYFRWSQSDAKAPAKKRLLAPADGPNLPLSLRDAGYLTYHHGKRGNTAPPIQARFEVNRYLKNDDAERKSGQPGAEIVDAAIKFFKERKEEKLDDRPVFMYLAFANPHDPRVAAPQFMKLYDRASIPLPKNYLPVHPFDNGEMTVRDEKLLPWPRTADAVRETLHHYYATVSGLDFHIGRLFEALQRLGEFENTIFLFSADHGISVGSHGLLGKQNVYEHGMKAPLVVAGPGIRQGHSDAMVYLLDIYPTLSELAGIEPPENIDGRSFARVLKQNVKGLREEIFLSYTDVQRAIRDERWKLIRYPHVGVTQLFDLRQDPHEIQNLANAPAHASRVDRMIERLKKAQASFGDAQPLTVKPLKPLQSGPWAVN